VDRGLDAQDHGEHQVDQRREQQGARVLPLRDPVEQGVEVLGPEQVLQGGLGHDAHRPLADERLQGLR